ncbi:radical SAM protein [uncultured Desulfovibrio sp.]|uniref:radical SAM protein n=1 Tax=uncultured Desulfovibrio sp. TaxID=167968 RepID=UPI00345ED777
MERADILHLLYDADAGDVRRRAGETLLRVKGTRVFVRGLVEFSNVCRRNCRYCGLRAPNRKLARYTLTQAEVLEAAARAVASGADSIVLQSGEGATDAVWLAEVVREIVRSLRVPVALSVGERPARDYALWRDAGATRYLLKHETADPALYARLHPGHSLAERVACLRVLAGLGYAAGTGFMTGLPGQTPDSLADDILLARELGVTMCGAGPFIPQADTPPACAPGPMCSCPVSPRSGAGETTASMTARRRLTWRLLTGPSRSPGARAVPTGKGDAGERESPAAEARQQVCLCAFAVSVT